MENKVDLAEGSEAKGSDVVEGDRVTGDKPLPNRLEHKHKKLHKALNELNYGVFTKELKVL